MNKEDITKCVDGEVYWIVNITKDMLNDDRWYAPKAFLDGIEATEGDIIAVEEKEGGKGRLLYVLKPKFLEKLNVTKKQGEILVKDIIKNMPKGSSVNNLTHVIEVKSHGRCGSRHQWESIFNEWNAEDGDFLVISYVHNEEDGLAWYFELLKKKNIPTYEREYMEGKKDGLATST